MEDVSLRCQLLSERGERGQRDVSCTGVQGGHVVVKVAVVVAVVVG